MYATKSKYHSDLLPTSILLKIDEQAIMSENFSSFSP